MKHRALVFFGIFLAAIAIGAAFWFYINQPLDTATADPAPPAAPQTARPATPPPPTPAAEPGPPPRVEATPAPADAAAGISPGVERISAILTDQNLNFAGAVTELLKLMPNLPEDEQMECAQHISNLSEDETVPAWGRLLEQNKLPAPAAEVLFNDLLNRPHPLGMPILAAIADQPFHPQFQDSRDLLEVLYGAPPQGTPWKNWVQTQLAESAPAP